MSADIIDFATRKRITPDQPTPTAAPAHPECLKTLTDYLTMMDVEDDIDIRKAIIVLPAEAGGTHVTFFDWAQETDVAIEQLQDAIERLRGFK